MLSKDRLKKDFAKEWKSHYQVALFKEMGFARTEFTKDIQGIILLCRAISHLQCRRAGESITLPYNEPFKAH